MTRSARSDILLAASGKAIGSGEARLLLDAATTVGVHAREVRWDEIGEGDETILIRHTWDYHRRPDDFRRWLEGLRAAGRRVHNAVDLILWNMEKGYLTDLAEAGVRTPSTVVLAADDDVPATDELVARLGTQAAVIKPTISATSYRTEKVDLADRDTVLRATRDAAAGSRAMIQAFLPGITGGEWSLMYFDGVFSHAVLKRAKEGEFRVQSDFGGSVEVAGPPDEALTAGALALGSLPIRPTFARVDGVLGDDGFILMELELIEPDLFLRHRADAAVRLLELVSAD